MSALIDIMPAKARRYVYAVLSFALAVWAIYEATQGDWTQFAVQVVGSLVAAMATANTPNPQPETH